MKIARSTRSINIKIYKSSFKFFTRTFQINFYEVLRIDKFSSIEKVNEAYKNILENHSEDKDLMFSVNLAYETLSNKDSKNFYDDFIKNDPSFDDWKFKDNIYCKDSDRVRVQYNHNNFNIKEEFQNQNINIDSNIEHNAEISLSDYLNIIKLQKANIKMIINKTRIIKCDLKSNDKDKCNNNCFQCKNKKYGILNSFELDLELGNINFNKQLLVPFMGHYNYKNDKNLNMNEQNFGDLLINFKILHNENYELDFLNKDQSIKSESIFSKENYNQYIIDKYKCLIQIRNNYDIYYLIDMYIEDVLKYSVLKVFIPNINNKITFIKVKELLNSNGVKEINDLGLVKENSDKYNVQRGKAVIMFNFKFKNCLQLEYGEKLKLDEIIGKNRI